MISRTFQPNSPHQQKALSFLAQGQKNHQLVLSADGTPKDADKRVGYVTVEVNGGVLEAGPDSYTEGVRSLKFSPEGTKFQGLGRSFTAEIQSQSGGEVKANYFYRENTDGPGDGDSTSIKIPRSKMSLKSEENEIELKRDILNLHKAMKEKDNSTSDLDPRPDHYLQQYSNAKATISPGAFTHTTFSANTKVIQSYRGDETLNPDSGIFQKQETTELGVHTKGYSPEGQLTEYRLSEPEQFLAEGGQHEWSGEAELRSLTGLRKPKN